MFETNFAISPTTKPTNLHIWSQCLTHKTIIAISAANIPIIIVIGEVKTANIPEAITPITLNNINPAFQAAHAPAITPIATPKVFNMSLTSSFCVTILKKSPRTSKKCTTDSAAKPIIGERKLSQRNFNQVPTPSSNGFMTLNAPARRSKKVGRAFSIVHFVTGFMILLKNHSIPLPILPTNGSNALFKFLKLSNNGSKFISLKALFNFSKISLTLSTPLPIPESSNPMPETS